MPAISARSRATRVRIGHARPVRVVDAVAFGVTALAQVLLSILAVYVTLVDPIETQGCSSLPPGACSIAGGYYATQIVYIAIAVAAAGTLATVIWRSHRRALVSWIPLVSMAFIAAAVVVAGVISRATTGTV